MSSSEARRGRAATRKFMGGLMTPREYHAAHAFPPGARCASCPRPPVVRAEVLAPLDEVRKRDADFEAISHLALTNPEAAQRFHAMLVPLKGGDGFPSPHVRISTVYACDACVPAMERALARGPSWVVVDIRRGPPPERLVTSG